MKFLRLLIVGIILFPIGALAYTPDDFVITVDTSQVSFGPTDQFTLATFGSGYDAVVDWGDGSTTTLSGTPGYVSHTYPTPGVYEVVITPNTPDGFPQIFYVCEGQTEKLLTIEQWGTTQWRSMDRAFNECTNLVVNATDTPDLSNATNLSQMFREASSLNSDISNWDVSTITNMQGMFQDATSFNQDISSWNVSNVTNMNSMFAGATAFNQDLSAWDVSSVISFYRLFYQSGWNQSLAAWSISPTAQISYMVSSNQFDQPFTSWTWLYNPTRTSWSGLLAGANAFTQNISSLVIPNNINDISEFFRDNSNFNQDISAWDVSNITNMIRMFENATSFNQPLSSWNVTNTTFMGSMFAGATAFNQDLSAWDVSSVTDMSYMFIGATSFDQSLGNWSVQDGIYIESILDNSGITTQNYSATLVGWASRNLMPGGAAYIGNIPTTYCDTAQAARDILVANGWIIDDEGSTADCAVEVDEEGSESSGGSSGTRMGERMKSFFYSSTTSSTPMIVTKETFMQSVRNFIDYLTKNEASLSTLTSEERTRVIVALRDIISFLLTLLPGV